MPLYTLTKDFAFEAAHFLPSHDGKCKRLHGHSWKLRVVVAGNTLYGGGPKAGMLMDYYDIGQVVKPLVESKLDHWCLNETTGLENPTSENLAEWIYGQLRPLLRELVAVEINETCTSACRFEP